MNLCPVLIVSGTNRPNSNTVRLARLLERHYREAGVPTQFYDLVDLPPELFLPGAYAAKPPAFAEVQRQVMGCAGMHLVTPEYNGSFPGALKYFIDMLKFPESFEHKPVAFVGVASGMWGALRAVEQLQMVFGYRNAYVYPDRVFVPGVGKKFDPHGAFTDDAIDQRLAKQAKGFAEFAEFFVPREMK